MASNHDNAQVHVPRGSIQCPLCAQVFAITATPQSTPYAAQVLSLDGGGIKGYSSLLILQQIMAAVIEEELERDPDLPPDELDRLQHPSAYFDYIVGTSTGGLIATMLGRLNLTVDECLQEYQRLGAEVFAHPRRAHAHNRLWAGSKYDYRRFEAVIEDVVRRHKRPRSPDEQEGEFEADLGPWRFFRETPPPPGQHFCRTTVVAVKSEDEKAIPYLFRSYIHRISPGQKTSSLNPSNHDCPLEIREVARATSAAPGYFSEFRKQSNGNVHVFADGGIRANNPSLIAWNEVLQMARLDNPSITGGKSVGCFISIGTGKSKYQIFGRENQNAFSKYLNMNKAPRKMLTDTDPTHKDMEKIAEDYSTPYFRFNVQHGLQNMMLDEWTEKKRDVFNEQTGRFEKRRMSTLDYLRLATEAYLASFAERASSRDPEVLVQDNIRDSARLLVEYRRAREVGSVAGGVPNGVVR